MTASLIKSSSSLHSRNYPESQSKLGSAVERTSFVANILESLLCAGTQALLVCCGNMPIHIHTPFSKSSQLNEGKGITNYNTEKKEESPNAVQWDGRAELVTKEIFKKPLTSPTTTDNKLRLPKQTISHNDRSEWRVKLSCRLCWQSTNGREPIKVP